MLLVSMWGVGSSGRMMFAYPWMSAPDDGADWIGWMTEDLHRNRYVHAPGMVTFMYFDRSYTLSKVWGRECWDEVRFLLGSL